MVTECYYCYCIHCSIFFLNESSHSLPLPLFLLSLFAGLGGIALQSPVYSILSSLSDGGAGIPRGARRFDMFDASKVKYVFFFFSFFFFSFLFFLFFLIFQTINQPLPSPLPRVGCPVLILHGSEDRVIPQHQSELLYTKLKENQQCSPAICERELVEGAGYFSFETQFADELIELLMGFLEKCTGRKIYVCYFFFFQMPF